MKGNTNINGSAKDHSEKSCLLADAYLHASPIPHLIVSVDGTIIFSNKAAQVLFDLTEDEFHTRSINSIFLEPFPLQNNFSASNALSLKAKNNNGGIVPVNAYVQRNEEESSFLVAVITNHEIKTLPKQKPVDSNLELFLDNSEESLLLVGKDLRVVMFNRTLAERAMGWTNLELAPGVDPLLMAVPEHRPFIKSMYEKALKGERVEFEYLLDVNGDLRNFQNIFKPAITSSGYIDGVFVIARDITETTKNKEAIETSEQRWRFALEGSNQGVWDWDIVKDETYFSSAWKRLLGYGEHEITNQNSEWEERIHPDDKDALNAHIENHFRSNNPYYETEYRLKAKDGSYKWILARGMIISKDQNGKPLRMIGTHTDITDRKNIEEKYKLFFYNNPLPMWTYDRETLRFLDVNNAAIEHYGYSREEFLTMSLMDIRPEEDRQQVFKTIEDNKNKANAEASAWRHKKKNGDIIFVNVTVRLFNEGEQRHGLVLAHDVTEKVIAEQKLINSREQYFTLFQEHPYPSWILERDSLRFLKVNGAAIEHYGYTREEMLDMTIYDLLPEENKHLLNPIYEQQDGHYSISKWVHVKKNGEKSIVDVKGRIITYNGQKAFLAVIVDVTDKVAAEKELVESNERYRLVSQATSDVIWDWNLKENTVIFSENFEKIFGWPLPEGRKLVADKMLPFGSPEHYKTIGGKRKAAIEDPACNHWSDEFTVKKADGSEILIHDKGFILRDKNGIALRAIGVLRDVTEDVKKEQELIASNERFELVAQATSEILWEADFKNKRTYVSPLFKEVFGYSVDDEDYFRNWPEHLHPEDKGGVLAMFQQSMQDAHCNKWRAECRHRKADGSYAHIVNHFIIIRDEAGVAVRLVGAIKDITSRRKADEEILRTNERFQFATSATSDIIWDYDINQGRILWSDNYHKVMGWELPEDKHLNLEECTIKIHPDDRDAVLTKMLNTFNDPGKSIWEDEFRYSKADGSYAYVVDRGFIIRDNNGKAERMIGAMQDISDRKYQEEIQSLELRVFEVSAVPGIHFHNVLKTLITGFESLHPEMYTSICLHNLSDEAEILAPRLAREHCRQLRYFIEKQKDKLQDQQSLRKNIIITSTDSEDWRYTSDAANYYNWKISWTLPVYHHSGDLLAFLMVFLDASRAPTDVEMNALARIRNLLRIIIGNYLSLEQIRISNERYDNVLKATHDLVWDWNLETGKFYRNAEGLRKVYGVEKEEDIENVYSWMQRIHPEDHTKVQRVINDILHATDQDKFDVEYRFKKDDGTYANIYDRGVIVRNKDGKPLRMIGAAQNITDRKKLEQELLQKELDKQKLISQATIDTQEEERREIGKELHDNVNQVLTTTKLYLDLSLSSPELKDELIKKSTKNIIYVINEIRQLSRSLMDPSIGDLGLIDSINDLVENINITRKLHVSVSADTELEKKLDESQKLTIFRIIQEAMNNTLKYAQATSVQLNIKKNKKTLELTIIDDGIGFNPSTVKKGAGLKNINNRVYLANGKLQLDSAPGKGCKIVINFPFNNKKQSN